MAYIDSSSSWSLFTKKKSSWSPSPPAAEEDHGQEHHQLAAETPKKRAGRTRHPVYRGVRSRKGDKWVCELREPITGTRVWLGTYTDADMAARAHDVAALAFRGKSACLNFADSTWRLPVPASTDVDDIRRAAAEAAEMFRPGSSSSTPAADVDDHDDEVYGYVEEEMEAVDMPRLLSEMAEGLLLSPPRGESDTWSYEERWDSCEDPDWSTLWS